VWFLALGVHHAMRIIVIRGLPFSKIVFHITINGMIFEKKVIENKKCVLIFSTIFV
jgi:hypothetical protein